MGKFDEIEEGAPDRRGSLRFPLRLAVKYQQIGSRLPGANWLMGQTLDISSTGLLFTTTEPLMPGQPVEACISWPIALDKRIPLKLVIKGLVVRSGSNHTAMSFERHEFRTAPLAEALVSE